MNKMYRIFLLFVISSIFISCGEDKGNNFYESQLLDQRLDLEKVDEFVVHSAADSAHTVGSLRFSFATNRMGDRHAFYDELKKQFIVTDDTGEIQQVIGKEGRGPGEILNAAGFSLDEKDQLVMVDQGQRTINVFDMEGGLKANATIDVGEFSMGGRDMRASQGRIYAGVFETAYLGNLRKEAHKSRLAGVYSYEGNLVDTVGVYDPTVKETASYNLFSIANVDFKNKKLLSTQYNNYRIQLYDLDNKERIAWFGRKTAHFKEGTEYIDPNMPRDKIQEKSVGLSTAAGVFATADYIILYFETLTESFFKTDNFNDKEPYVAVYNRESYDSYGDLALPYVVGNIANDHLYLIEDDNPDSFSVGVYELTEES